MSVNICNDITKCCGCRACENICPANAIVFIENDKGFKYPQIDESKCINCNKCFSTCPVHEIHTDENEIYEQKYYAVRNKNENILKESTSGGVFFALANTVLSGKGIVYGACLDENLYVKHIRITSESEIHFLQKTKYVESDISSIYKQIISDLNNGKEILFVGTPCQTAGISAFLKNFPAYKDKVILCDFICHGAASPMLWKEYCYYIETKYSSKIHSYSFRNKTNGWRNSRPDIILENGKNISELHRRKESYLLLYNTNFLLRDNCFSCKYTSYKRYSDITMADFWNIGQICKTWDDNKGVSTVLINSNKGMELFKTSSEMLEILECGKQDVWQPYLEYPNEIPKSRNAFWNDYNKNGFKYIIEKYGSGNYMSSLKICLSPIARKLGLYVFFGKLYKKLFVKQSTNEQRTINAQK